MNERVELHVILAEDGQLSVTGPLHQRLICLGLLEMARDVIIRAEQPDISPQILRPALFVPHLRK